MWMDEDFYFVGLRYKWALSTLRERANIPEQLTAAISPNAWAPPAERRDLMYYGFLCSII